MKPRTSLSRRLRQRRGVAAVEAALAIALVLIPLCLGAIGLGMALVTVNRLDRALQAAIFYAWANPGSAADWGEADSANLAATRAAAETAYGAAMPGATIDTAVAFYCVSGGYTQVPPAIAYNAACQAGQSIATYLTVIARASVVPPGVPLAAAIPLTVTGTVRVR